MIIFKSTLMTLILYGASSSLSYAASANDDCNGQPPAFAGAFGCQVTVDQGWDPEQQLNFWFTGQGSNIIPYSWFLSLEIANDDVLFINPDNINSYRYLPQGKSGLNLDDLPVGFTKDATRSNEQYQKISQQWLGLTCAACHTGQLEYGGRKVLIDGAPAMADFQSFFEDMTTAMRATINNPAKFRKFADRVTEHNNDNDGATDEDTLKKYLITVTEVLEKRNAWNSGSIRFGNGRLDALGSILNQVLVAHGKPMIEGSVSAPVSYPFIWDTPQLDRVQWNGSVVNAGLGALGRNAGEVIGVFGLLTPGYYPTTGIPSPVPEHKNSTNIANLGRLEELVWNLKSPRWEEVWEGTDVQKIDSYLASVGRGVYAKKCLGCHALPIDRDNRNSEITVTMVSINQTGTDPTAAVNFASRGKIDGGLLSASVAGVVLHELQTNKLETLKTIKAGQPEKIRIFVDQLAARFLAGLDQDVSVTQKRQMIMQFLGGMKQEQMNWVDEGWRKKKQEGISDKYIDEAKKCAIDFLCYKARPLNGVWATGPYLHNGSVRTIRQLLVPGERQKEFNVGSREYDPTNMGFKDAGNFVMDTTLKGNLNTGHEYFGNYFEVYEGPLLALMEYLKTL